MTRIICAAAVAFLLCWTVLLIGRAVDQVQRNVDCMTAAHAGAPCNP